ncbi:MAG: DUF4143 domain-containing protein, partial [Candidatus Omnitrophica bacterium]|nr:DUF4143 domain-containing protein [Candidatus Omnitrophota bacterium]
IKKFSYSLKEQTQRPRKCYIVDNGLRFVYGFKFSEDEGKNLENAVFLELQHRKIKEPLMEIFYWNDYKKREVDFVVKQGKNVEQLIQVCAKIDDFKTKERETIALLKAEEELKCKNLLIITHDYEKEEKVDSRKIVFKPIWKWLIEQRG